MSTIDQRERTILSQARTFIEPTLQDETRVLARLVATSGIAAVTAAPGALPQASAGSTDAAAPPVADSWFRRLMRVATSRKAVAVSFAALGAGVGYHSGFAAGRQSVLPISPPEAKSAAPAEVTERILPNAGRRAEPVARSQPASPGSNQRWTGPPSSTGSKRSRSGDAISVPSSAADSLAEELALLRRSEQAIRSGHSLLALTLLRELDRRFPNGRLSVERRAAQVMARCLGLAPEAARRTGEAYLKSATGSVYHERVRQLCGIDQAQSSGSAGEKGSGSSGD